MAQLPYPITVEGHRDNQPMFVRLISEADDGFTPKHVIVQPQSNIEYLEARTPVARNEDANAISFSVNRRRMDQGLHRRRRGLDPEPTGL
jgi:hypothetical protein